MASVLLREQATPVMMAVTIAVVLCVVGAKNFAEQRLVAKFLNVRFHMQAVKEEREVGL